MIQVYTLSDPRTHLVCYVGISNNAQKRYRQHLKIKNPNHPKEAWILELQQIGLSPILTIIDEAESEEGARILEKQWVDHYAQANLLKNWNLNTRAIGENMSQRRDDPVFAEIARRNILKEVGYEEEEDE